MKSAGSTLQRFLDRIRRLVRDIGWAPTFRHGICLVLGTTRLMRLKTPCAKHPLEVRAGTSDVGAFRQIFCDREYGCFDDLAGVATVIDCGANVGYTSVYFLNRFPNCTVLAIEPDRTNFQLLQRNLAPYAGRFEARCAAVWSRNVGLKVLAAPIKHGRVEAWSIAVTEAGPGETADMQGTTIPDLLKAVGGSRVSILKVDIEGAESPVFSEDCSGWLPRIENIAIELHGEAAENIFARAIQGAGYTVSRSGELTVCRRIERTG